MVQVARGWDLDVERGPDWLFVRPHAPANLDDASLAEQVWGLLEQNFTNRLVLELDEIRYLSSSIIGQLVLLYKRIHTHQGMMRICGLSPRNEAVLALCRLGPMMPNYADRTEAVMCGRPLQPR